MVALKAGSRALRAKRSRLYTSIRLYLRVPGTTSGGMTFAGASEVFTVVLKPEFAASVSRVLGASQVFKIGASSGGTHSMISPLPVCASRTATIWGGAEPVLRINVGLESPSELSTNLDRFFAVLASGVHDRAYRAAE